jgi:hypothetical protein
MGIETRYEYIYYTVINTNELSPMTREEWFNDGFTWNEAINYVEHLFKTSEDKSVNNYKVEYAGYEQDIDSWIRTHERHKERPVFVKFHDNQPIKTEGEGDLFVIYEYDGVHYSSASDDEVTIDQAIDNSSYWGPDAIDEGTIDGLAAAGGRL